MKAIQRLIRDDKGQVKVILIDALTLQPVVNPAGYEVINQKSQYWEPVQDVSDPDVPSKVQPKADILNHYIKQSGGDPTAPAVSQAVQTHAATSDATKGMTWGGTPEPGATKFNIGEVAKTVGTSPGTKNMTWGGTPPPGSTAFNIGEVARDLEKKESTPKADMSIAAPENRGFAALTHREGPHRPNPPSTEISDKVREAAAKAYGPGTTVSVTSGAPEPGEQYGSNRHNLGLAMDFQITRPDGSLVTAASPDAEDFAETAKTMGVKGVGFGPEYMGGTHFHMDTVTPGVGQDNEWGSLANSWKQQLDSAGYLGATKTERDQPHAVPQARPETVSQGIISAAKDVTKTGIQGDPTRVSAAQIASLGKVRTPDQISRMAYTFAGELSPSQLSALEAGDETARQELAGMIATSENRAALAKSFDDVFDPAQYNSLYDSKKDITQGNYAKYGSVLRDNISGFYTGDLKPQSYDVTGYYNQDISNPSWGLMNKGPYGLKGAKQVGEHTFGFTKDRLGKTSDLSGQANRPTEGSRFGLGGLGRGLDSPSESGGRFGGSGLGSSSYSGKGGSDSPSESGSRFGGSGLGSSKSSKSTGYGSEGKSSQSVGPSGGGKSWGGPR